VAQKSNLARYGNYLIYQDNEGIVHLHFIMSTEKNNWRNLDVEASKGTKLGIIPLFRDYSKTMDRLSADNFTNPFNEIALGVFYIDSSSHLAAAKVGNDGEDPFRSKLTIQFIVQHMILIFRLPPRYNHLTQRFLHRICRHRSRQGTLHGRYIHNLPRSFVRFQATLD
jgi:hypothetical protein